MTRKHLKSAEEAWDAAEKVFADLGIEWALLRSRDRFHMATPDEVLRVAVEECDPHGWQFVVVHKTTRLAIWRCSWPPVESLTELLTMLGYGTHIDGPVCDPECREPQAQCFCDPEHIDGSVPGGGDTVCGVQSRPGRENFPPASGTDTPLVASGHRKESDSSDDGSVCES